MSDISMLFDISVNPILTGIQPKLSNIMRRSDFISTVYRYHQR